MPPPRPGNRAGENLPSISFTRHIETALLGDAAALVAGIRAAHLTRRQADAVVAATGNVIRDHHVEADVPAVGISRDDFPGLIGVAVAADVISDRAGVVTADL